MRNCLLPEEADRLKVAFRDANFVSDLVDANSKGKVKLISKYTGGASAKEIVANMEKALIQPQWKRALKEFVRKATMAKKLYFGISENKALEMGENLTINDLKKLNEEQLNEEFGKFVEEKIATRLAKSFIRLKQKANLAQFEKMAFGKTDIAEQKKILGSYVNKINRLDELGVLTPDQKEKFMETMVETELGIDINLEESQKISELATKHREAFESINDIPMTSENKKLIDEYLESRNELEKYLGTLKDSDLETTLEVVSDIFRANILARPKTAINSLFYQATPFLQNSIVNKIIKAELLSDTDTGSVVDAFSKLENVKLDQKEREFVKKQVAFNWEMYRKHNYDFSRMEDLDSGYKVFGERKQKILGKKFSQEKTLGGKIAAVTRAYGKIISFVPKYFAGGTDTFFAGHGRAKTTVLAAKQLASYKAKNNKLGAKTQEQYKWDLVDDANRFVPKTIEGARIKNISIKIANELNSTQNSALADSVIKLRNALKIKGFSFGKVLIPFARISSTAIQEGIKTGSGYGIIKSLFNINKFSHSKDYLNLYKSTMDLAKYATYTGAGILIANMVDDDDYIGNYWLLDQKEYQLAKSQGIRPGSIRIAGQLIELKYLPIINTIIAGIMESKKIQNKKSLTDALNAYAFGFLSQVSDVPGFSEIGDISKNIEKTLRYQNMKYLGFDKDALIDFAKVRILPSIISETLEINKKDKYDFLGRNLKEKSQKELLNDDKANKIIYEFNKLNKKDLGPVISEPNTKDAKELKQKIGDKRYYSLLNEFRKEYQETLLKFIDSISYQKIEDEDQQKKFNDIRTKYILRRIEKENNLIKK